MRILLTGGTGQVGWELRRALAPVGEVSAPSRRELDLADPEGVARAVRDARPDVVVNAAAYTDVDGAEEEPELVRRVNAAAPGVLAREARKLDVLLVHYSTDYVFDGTKGEPYVEEDEPAPQSVYARTKLAGEEAVRRADGRHLILRTSWVYGLRGRNFLRTMLRLFRERDEVRVVDDQRGAPTWSRLVASGTALLLAGGRSVPTGTRHLAAAGSTTWFGFARAIRETLREAAPTSDAARSPCRLVPTTTEAYGAPAPRPADARLSSDRVARETGVRLPHWRPALALCLEELAEQRP